jgi:hypothetical protein
MIDDGDDDDEDDYDTAGNVCYDDDSGRFHSY